ncbi:family 43 glycosylhydrolase [Pseudoduganella sp. UC29_106]|uniref:family 43 glycosylhydrolase n=1 Tax=Pseudoduganella sp. UC29_106 TaxID=3374553 RepID=UPI0037563F7C
MSRTHARSRGCGVRRSAFFYRGCRKYIQWGDLGNGRYRNPILPADYSELDAIRVGDDYFTISSTFQFSPGMAILHSRDLVNWSTVGHAVPDLTRISPELNWTRMNRYGRGICAGAIRHHAGRFRLG